MQDIFYRLKKQGDLNEAQNEIKRSADFYFAEGQRLGKISLLDLVRYFRNEFEKAQMAYTPYHSRQTAKIALFLALEYGMPPSGAFICAVGGFLHDIGKIVIPKIILKKEERTGKSLSKAERGFIRDHPENGEVMLSHFNDFPEENEGELHELTRQMLEVRRIVRSHQERFDGSFQREYPGYPDFLHGDEIPLGARMAKIGDALSAMSTHRFYRNKLYSLEDAVAVLLKFSWKEFDPELVKTLVKALYRIPEKELDALAKRFSGKEFHSSIQNVFAENIDKIPVFKLRKFLKENGLECSILDTKRKALKNAYYLDPNGLKELLLESGVKFDQQEIGFFQKFINKDNRRLEEWEKKIRSPEMDERIQALYDELELGQIVFELPPLTSLA